MKGLVLVTGDEDLRRQVEAYCACLGMGFSNEVPVERAPDWALAADLGLLAPLASGLPNQDPSKIFAQVVALSAQGSFHARVQAIRLGATSFLERPVTAADICDVLDDAAIITNDDPVKVLIVDDDPIVARVTGRQMELAGMRVLALQDPSKALESIRDFQPDIAILDLYMPQCSGTELAQAIRQMRRFEALPIVFLSSEGELAAQMNAVSAGGDDFVAKGTPGALMIPLIRSRAARMRRLSRHWHSDSATGLLAHGTFKEVMNDALAAAGREGSPLCVALIDLDGFRAVNDAHGHEVGDGVIRGLSRLLRHRLDRGCMAGRFSGQQIAVTLPATTLDEALARLDLLRVLFSGLDHRGGDGGLIRATFSAGVVQAQPGEGGDALMGRARVQVLRAKDLGRNRIAAATE